VASETCCTNLSNSTLSKYTRKRELRRISSQLFPFLAVGVTVAPAAPVAPVVEGAAAVVPTALGALGAFMPGVPGAVGPTAVGVIWVAGLFPGGGFTPGSASGARGAMLSGPRGAMGRNCWGPGGDTASCAKAMDAGPTVANKATTARPKNVAG